jgi:hypothetical protein
MNKLYQKQIGFKKHGKSRLDISDWWRSSPPAPTTWRSCG